jgi:hypothetical protein
VTAVLFFEDKKEVDDMIRCTYIVTPKEKENFVSSTDYSVQEPAQDRITETKLLYMCC